ncbi:copper homeostasis periplasmic binding protein CopC [Serratia sp. UGAL515B_01]|uniref:copper homeostasis periplasmic binding protein CopC n=1 Tax=Serratia sp. UGAL515B_01 TaxID=2986763 RepID=UPI002954BF48|nr:copper homeostasis periplasmic binding protein CopC [Serratia sp. UGAL515B_01]WON78027.1 copper homeostasis periplasmic binding protein CopC [Serratia sp. UGAL515B_01]
MVNNIKKLGTAAVLLASLFVTQQALAHAYLKDAVPADKSEVATSPKQLTLKFTGDVEASFSGIELKDAKGDVIPTGKATLDSTDKSSLIVPLDKELDAGQYNVDWRVLSVDGHKSEGQYSFSVK